MVKHVLAPQNDFGMPKITWSNFKRSGIWVDTPPSPPFFSKFPHFPFFWERSLTSNIWHMHRMFRWIQDSKFFSCFKDLVFVRKFGCWNLTPRSRSDSTTPRVQADLRILTPWKIPWPPIKGGHGNFHGPWNFPWGRSWKIPWAQKKNNSFDWKKSIFQPSPRDFEWQIISHYHYYFQKNHSDSFGKSRRLIPIFALLTRGDEEQLGRRKLSTSTGLLSTSWPGWSTAQFWKSNCRQLTSGYNKELSQRSKGG